MQDLAFREWLVSKSWALGVRYSKVVACLLPLGALAVHARFLAGDWQTPPPGFAPLLAWQLSAELFFISVVLADHWWPQLRTREWALNAACAGAVALATWLCIVDGRMRSDLSIYAAGLTFVAAVMCTPRPVRLPMYILSFLTLSIVAGLRAPDSAAVLVALANPFCIVVLCVELDKFTHARNVELYTETQRAQAERARADKVLYNVLPAVIADELKRDGRVKALKFENMGVLFADIAGFTRFSRALPPDALVLVLNDIFSAFDELVERHALEKIKTIGDAYMVVSDQRLDGLAQLALDMRDALRNYNRSNGTALDMRIGMHAGPAVAGVIGVKRFLYDVWGDTVNVASRMESTGATGQIQVSEAVYRQLRGQFEFRGREALDIKGGGTLATWWLLGAVARADSMEGGTVAPVVAATASAA
ncbi:MAG: adenylate/guanylate cyclase domain-containing protein [Polaromonas sp.]|nr:adenylate/guanylate cyclase domain-containing protein [Polaromonas sp.]